MLVEIEKVGGEIAMIEMKKLLNTSIKWNDEDSLWEFTDNGSYMRLSLVVLNSYFMTLKFEKRGIFLLDSIVYFEPGKCR